jgi:acyl-CoA reductase-like NAD-dependent aldehyde dehydrogenase
MAWTSEDGAFSIAHPDRIYVGGKWIEPSTSRRFSVVNPATEEVHVQVAEAMHADIDRAVAAARKAFDEGPWPRMTPVERAGYLSKLAQALRDHSVDLGHAWTREMGVVFSISQHAGTAFSAFVDQHAGWGEKFPWVETKPTLDGLGGDAQLVQEPVGVVAAIVPWNAAFLLSIIKIVPALLAGCTIVLKASPEAPLGPYLIAEYIDSLGLPPGVFNIVTADREVSEHLVRHPDVDKVTFTGSTAAGRRIASICGERIARCTLELGGKSPAIVLNDYDLGKFAGTLAQTTSYMTNQVCAALTRIIVPRQRHDALVDALASEFEKIRIGDPYDADTQMGPLAMERQLERVLNYIEIGRDEGKLVTGGNRPKHMNRGYYVEPTIFANVDSQARIGQEEIFGPVVAVIPAVDEEDAVRLANDTIYGLDASVFTNDRERAYSVARQVRSGTVGHNLHRTDFGVSFGGFKQSGLGREGGYQGLRAYLEQKAIMLAPE